MIRIPVSVTNFEHLTGKSSKTGKDYDFYDIWVSVEGYPIPWHDTIYSNQLDGVSLEIGLNGYCYIAQDRNMKPRLSYKFG